MRMLSKTYLLSAAALALLGAGVAEAATARLHTMKVDAPDGSIVHVEYAGEVAPHVEIVPVSEAAAMMPLMADPSADMERISAMMDAQMQAMMQQAALVQQQALASGEAGAPGVTMAADAPRGMHVTYYSSSTDARGCTRAVSYSSDGSGAQPKMTQVASDSCEGADRQPVIPAKAQVPAGHPDATQTAPGRKV